MPTISPSSAVLAAIATAVMAIFMVDMATPLGLGVPFLYLLATLIAIGTRQSNRALVALALLCPLLAAVKLQVSMAGGVLAFGQGNRLIFTFLIWTVTSIELVRRRIEGRIKAERLRFQRDLESLVHERTEALHRANRELQQEVAERKLAEATIQGYADRLHGLAGRLVEAQEIERTHLAAELHDRIGQNLSALNINLSLALAQVPPPAAARLRDSVELVEETTEMVRDVMEELRPTLLDQYGLDAALRWHGEKFSERTGIELRHETGEGFPRLRRPVEIALFRIVQEALINVAKHARAQSVLLSLARTGAGIRLAVADDGVGLDGTRAPAGSGGWGLTIMAERARAIAAHFHIEAAAGGGTCLAVSVPDSHWEIEHDH